MLKLIDVHSYYGESHILRGISLEVRKNSVVALIGRNGMGKTTTLHSINGFVPPRRGIVKFMGKEITGYPPHVIARMGLGLVPQGRRIFPSLSVRENLTMSARRTSTTRAWDLERIHALFPVLANRSSFGGSSLSGGEQQMLTIARALMTNPSLLLMDEPSEGLAPIVLREIGNVIGQLKDEGLSIFLVEQNVPLALKLTDYVYVISKGELVYESSPQELKENRQAQTRHLGV